MKSTASEPGLSRIERQSRPKYKSAPVLERVRRYAGFLKENI